MTGWLGKLRAILRLAIARKRNIAFFHLNMMPPKGTPGPGSPATQPLHAPQHGRAGAPAPSATRERSRPHEWRRGPPARATPDGRALIHRGTAQHPARAGIAHPRRSALREPVFSMPFQAPGSVVPGNKKARSFEPGLSEFFGSGGRI
ncbi:MAG: hypothetical protein ACOY6E_03970 [Pseudomonadota bacterium]